MNILTPRAHGYLDYVVVVVFLLAPVVFGLTGFPAVLSYLLALVHLALTLLSNFVLGAVKVIPMNLHGMIEVVVGPVLIILGIVFGGAAAAFYISIGLIIMLVWVVTNYRMPASV